MPGILYAVNNKASPAMLKIGFTERTMRERLNELSRTTGVLDRYEVVHSVNVTGSIEIWEAKIHEEFNDYRENSSREGFGGTY
jgi:hypothetical protein